MGPEIRPTDLTSATAAPGSFALTPDPYWMILNLL